MRVILTFLHFKVRIFLSHSCKNIRPRNTHLILHLNDKYIRAEPNSFCDKFSKSAIIFNIPTEQYAVAILLSVKTLQRCVKRQASESSSGENFCYTQ
jgi:hypothetical protein